jgi:hypothetical protein
MLGMVKAGTRLEEKNRNMIKGSAPLREAVNPDGPVVER